ncbi:MAG: hypothetical protein R2710_11765 [Acidimicrobiales bacterium]
MRKCAIDLAPEAPWACPADCSGFEPRLADVNWRHGSLITPATPDAPDSLGQDPSIGALLDSARRHHQRRRPSHQGRGRSGRCPPSGLRAFGLVEDLALRQTLGSLAPS